jgi:hypothetical protein
MTWDDHYFEERLTRNTTELHNENAYRHVHGYADRHNYRTNGVNVCCRPNNAGGDVMPMITNQEMRKALTIVIDIAKANTIPPIITDPVFTAKRDKQLKAIELVERLQTLLFMHNLTRGKDSNDIDR